jgi:CHAD domain-containing protein
MTRLLLERRARALKKHLPAAIEGDGTGVHKARVASRRLREAVPVLGEDASPRKAAKVERKIRKVTRALGAVRELDVTLALLDELVEKGTLPRVGLEEVRTHVVEERERRRATMLKRLGTLDLAKLARRLATLAAALQEPGDERWREILSVRLGKRGTALAEAIASAGQLYGPERLHQVRIATKKLRYSLEIAAETGLPSAATLLRQLKRTQETLGRLHDLQVLETHVAAVQARPEERALPPGSLAEISRALEGRCRHLHGRYVAAAPPLLGVVEATQATVIPQLLAPRTSTTSDASPGKTARRTRRAVRATADSGKH